MGESLRDQLLKAGLVSKAKVKNVDIEAKRKAKQARKKESSGNAAVDTDSAALRAAKRQAEKVARDKELNRQKEAIRVQKELKARVRQLIKRNQVNDPEGEIPRNFVEGKHIKRMYVNEEQNKMLSEGRLAITVFGERHYLVPLAIAENLLEISPQSVVFLNRDDNKKDPNDPYADYQIPDDLMW